MVSDARMSTPPMVGVPFFSIRWRSGPSGRIGWPARCTVLSQRMKLGPTSRLIVNAVRHAAPALNVR